MGSSLVSDAASGCARRLPMLRRALGGLLKRLAKPPLSALDLARKARWQAAEDYADAKRSRDTRSIHHAYAAFRRATAEVVRLELNR